MNKFWGFAVLVGLAGASAAGAQQVAFSLADAAAPAGFSSSAGEPAEKAAVIAVPQQLPKKDNSVESARVRPFSRVAIGTKVGTLGWGGQIATPITRQLNLRGGVNIFNFGYGLTNDGTNYYASLHLKSGTVQADYFPFHRASFHLSPGLLIFNSRAGASMYVPGGNSFTENDVDYTSDPSDPVHGSGTVTFGRTVMPAFTIGFGNMITRRESRHWGSTFEIGAAYTGHYTMGVNLAGSVCNQDGCGSVNDPSVQVNVTEQQNKINETFKKFQILPIITTGVTYRF